MEEHKYNSKSKPWKDRYESFFVIDKEVIEWTARARRFDRIEKLAEEEGKVLNYTMLVGEGGELIIDVECH